MRYALPGMLTFALVFSVSSPARAYIGPGAGLTAIGAAVAFVLAVVFAAIGFIWYPIRRLLRRGKRR